MVLVCVSWRGCLCALCVLYVCLFVFVYFSCVCLLSVRQRWALFVVGSRTVWAQTAAGFPTGLWQWVSCFVCGDRRYLLLCLASSRFCTTWTNFFLGFYLSARMHFLGRLSALSFFFSFFFFMCWDDMLQDLAADLLPQNRWIHGGATCSSWEGSTAAAHFCPRTHSCLSDDRTAWTAEDTYAGA